MISDFKQIEILFEEINHNLTSKVHVYLIGGVVLLYQGLKPATKDIDLIILKKQEFVAFEQALKAVRFETKIPTGAYKKMNLSQIYIRNDFRIDAFHETVCRKFSLSKGMRKRTKKLFALSYLDLNLCSNEDIFVFKTFTEREGDLEDCIALAEKGLDWNVIINELQAQI